MHRGRLLRRRLTLREGIAQALADSIDFVSSDARIADYAAAGAEVAEKALGRNDRARGVVITEDRRDGLRFFSVAVCRGGGLLGT